MIPEPNALLPLTREAFAAALRRGLGRALMHVRQHGLEDVADLVLEGCLENQTYDPQCEGGRSEWMYDFFKDSPRRAEFRDAILARLRTTPPSYDLEHLCGLASALAADGDTAAREGLRARVLEIARSATASDSHGARIWVALSGVDGLLELAECYGTRLLANPDEDVPDPTSGSEHEIRHREALREKAAHSPAIRAYSNWLVTQDAAAPNSAALDPKTRSAQRRTDFRRDFPLEKILQMASRKEGRFPGRYMQFGRHANDEERRIIYDRLLAESDNDVRVRLLWVFRRTALPQVDPLLLDWAAGPHPDLRAAALVALAGSRDARIHHLARARVDSGRLLGPDDVVLNLFVENYDASDPPRIARALAAVDPDPDDAHALASSIVDLASRHRDPALADALAWAYEHTPCSLCRHEVVSHQRSLHLLDARQLAECRSDANERIRNLAEDQGMNPV